MRYPGVSVGGYGLQGTGARVAGFLILLASVALPRLLVPALILA